MSLIPYRAEDYALIERQITADAVKKQFGRLTRGSVTRYALPNLGAFNFVLEETLQGGVNDSLNLDTHGKSRSAYVAGDDGRGSGGSSGVRGAGGAGPFVKAFLKEYLAFSAHGAWSGPVSRRLPRRSRVGCLRQDVGRRARRVAA